MLKNQGIRVVMLTGDKSVTAHAVAARLGCSTQPLFREFESMEQIKDEVARLAMGMYARHIAEGAASAPVSYKGTGLAYIDFARREPQLFKLLFMQDRVSNPVVEIEDPSFELVISSLMGAGIWRARLVMPLLGPPLACLIYFS